MKNLRLNEVKTRPRPRSQVKDVTRFKAPLPEAPSCATGRARSSPGAAEKARLAAAPPRDPREGGRSHRHVTEASGPASPRPLTVDAGFTAALRKRPPSALR